VAPNRGDGGERRDLTPCKGDFRGFQHRFDPPRSKIISHIPVNTAISALYQFVARVLPRQRRHGRDLDRGPDIVVARDPTEQAAHDMVATKSVER
jgi:hypothetical protein